MAETRTPEEIRESIEANRAELGLAVERLRREVTKATDWLTAHPQASYVLSTTIDDARSDGVAKALTQSGREGYAVGLDVVLYGMTH